MYQDSNKKRIAKNTIFLYFRMMFTMLVALYTSRIILQVLGINDYGIYQAVGGIVGFLSFIKGALSTGSSRFLTYELGRDNDNKLKRTFSTTLIIHIILALIIILLAETIGLWFLYNKLQITPERMDAAIYIFHFSVLTMVFTLIQVPYTATIIAHEQMSMFAYLSIIEVSAKLLIIYLLGIGNFDKLEMYATLLFIVQVIIVFYYIIYCHSRFKESSFNLVFDKKIFCNIAGFSSWNLFAASSLALNSQGILLLLNMFFSPSVVAARAISIQVNMATNQFVNNFRIAVNPQIIKKYAVGDYEGSKSLLLSSTKLSYYMMFIISFPICLLAEPLLKLWLGIVPEYTIIFVQLIVIQSLFQVFDSSFYIALHAKGRMKENALISPLLGFLMFPIIYVLFKAGYSPVVLSWASLITYAVIGLIVKPFLIVRIVDYKWNEIKDVFSSCFLTTIIALPCPLLFYYYIPPINLITMIYNVLISVIIIALCIYYIGLDKQQRIFILNSLKRIVL